MTAFIFVIVILLIILAAVAVSLTVWYVENIRDKKNYERALKLVPLLIHLPPMSEDIVSNGRDIRDLVDENISKAQIIYNIIASTYQKGLKNRLYGQRYLSFEIVGSQGLVYFYAMVPLSLVDVVKQAIISAYSTAQIEEVAEHNIFNRVGKISSVTGGEFVLKKPYSYPIATYQDLKSDTMQALLNALSTLDKEDGASIQILIRAADAKWRQKSSATASNVRKGKSSKGGLQSLGLLIRQAIEAYYRPPEFNNSPTKDDKPELSNLDQAVLDSVDDKTRYQGYETLIRVVVSSNVSQRSQAILANLTGSFTLFDAPGKNGFKYVPAERADQLVSDYILRLFPQHKNKMILNSVELATLFHFPDQRSIPTSQLKRQESKQVDGPRNIPVDGLLLGYNVFRGAKKAIRIALEDRQKHVYVVGQTGTGKSTFLENLALQDMLNGNGFAFVDPHGDTVDRLLAMVPKERTEDIIYFSPAEMDYPMGLNIFEFDTPEQKDFLIQEALNMLYKLYDPQHQGIMGPRYEHLFRNAALTVMADPAGGTFIDIPKLFRDPKYVQQKLQYVKDRNVREFWEKELPQSQRSNEFGDVVSWFISKFGAFLSNEMMRNIIGQSKSAFDLREIMDKKKILLVNLSKGRTGELNSKLLGMVIIMKFQSAAMSRASMPEKERSDFSLFVDEFQNFSTESFATIMSEARKYHLNLIVANQFTTQLTEEIQDAIFGNIGTTVAFRVGDRDAEVLSKYFRPAFEETDLLRLPNYNTVVRTMIEGVPTQPFSMATLPPLGSPNPRLANALKQLTAAKYGRSKLAVETEIFARMETKPEFKKTNLARNPYDTKNISNTPWSSAELTPTDSLSSNAPTSTATTDNLSTTKQKTGSSFLDEWLSKRGRSKNTKSKHLEEVVKPVASPTDHQLQPSQMTKNISSDSLEKNEIDQLAAQLRHELVTKPDKAAPEKEKSSMVDNEIKAKILDNSSDVFINKHNRSNPDSLEKTKKDDASDTIYIDREGELHIKQDKKETN
ncbi:MAG: type IV secretory system conjugative DNA transfer family protein [Candidatus Saccharimonadales bacterium]